MLQVALCALLAAAPDPLAAGPRLEHGDQLRAVPFHASALASPGARPKTDMRRASRAEVPRLLARGAEPIPPANENYTSGQEGLTLRLRGGATDRLPPDATFARLHAFASQIGVLHCHLDKIPREIEELIHDATALYKRGRG